MASQWAGKQWGGINIPRIGQEVVVVFEEGDPDQPIIVGNVYNAEQMPPYSLPDNMTQSGFKSRSSPGGSMRAFQRAAASRTRRTRRKSISMHGRTSRAW